MPRTSVIGTTAAVTTLFFSLLPGLSLPASAPPTQKAGRRSSSSAVPTPTPPAAEETTTPVCDKDRALGLIEIALTDTAAAAGLSDAHSRRRRVELMLRAARLLWRADESRARTLLADAFEAATDLATGKADTADAAGGVRMIEEDPRVMVIREIARRGDADWAARLAGRMAVETKAAKETGETAAEDDSSSRRRGDGGGSGDAQTAGHLLGLAASLVDSETAQAVGFARASLRHPATHMLPFFLYQLAATDRAAADRFYREALGSYANAGTSELLYLSAYAFGEGRMLGPAAMSLEAPPPEGFRAGAAEQRLFVDALLARARSAPAAVPQQPAQGEVGGGGGRGDEQTQIYQALQGAESLLLDGQRRQLSAAESLAGRVARTREMLGGSLGETERTRADATFREQQHEQKATAGDLLERAEAETDADRRDMLIAQAVVAKNSEASFDRTGRLIEKVGDAKLRAQLRSFLSFARARHAVRSGALDAAREHAAQVDEPDLRAYLAAETAAAWLERADGRRPQKQQRQQDAQGEHERQRAREALDEAAEAATKAFASPAQARALAGVTYLYARLDRARALVLLGETVAAFNRLEADVAAAEHPYFNREISGQKFTMYATYELSGFSLENTFAVLARQDFDGTLGLAQTLSDGGLRAAMTMAVAGMCLDKAVPANGKSRAQEGRPKKNTAGSTDSRQ